MAIYCIGDIQGCDSALQRLLDQAGFSPSRDHVYLLGDLVNRGPESAAVLRRCMAADGAISAILGNHDLHLLARHYKARKKNKRDTLGQVLKAPDAQAMLHWLRHQPLARWVDSLDEPLLLVHAGLLPQWTARQALALAAEVEAVLRDEPRCIDFMHSMYGNTPDVWDDALQGADRLRAIVNALTRLRFCTLREGRMDFSSSESAAHAPEGCVPWFDVPWRASADTMIAFGHWSTLGLQDRDKVLALDTGCVWGGCLSAMRFGGASLAQRELLQVRCEAAQTPG
ncbi:symmetrical bis(5'-nucleosyl)-tetraphosphatase [Vandammella animalimorsus]|uniref:symmetrical bis(5'-nucleosyl)-tetraphosphatase n=1 Tax=Vandammella animalimorsus TaxID=2029117 RepID=UPI00325ABE3B